MSGIIMTSLDVNDDLGVSPYDSPRLILEGVKTQTRRMVKDGQRLDVVEGKKTVLNPSGSIKWQVGRTYATPPKRAQKAYWYRFNHLNQLEFAHEANASMQESFRCKYWGILKKNDFKQLRIRILDIEQQSLHDITDDDVIAEGVYFKPHSIAPIFWNYSEKELQPIPNKIAYLSLLSTIHKDDYYLTNPLVWKLTFEVDKDA